MQDQIDNDIKSALLAGDKTKAQTLRTVKSSLINEAIAAGAQDKSLSDEQVQKVLAKEAKKRTEAAELYRKAGAAERAEAELAEKALIEVYLPEQLDESQISAVVSEEISKLDSPTTADMGPVIGAARARLGTAADGAVIARLVKEALEAK